MGGYYHAAVTVTGYTVYLILATEVGYHCIFPSISSQLWHLGLVSDSYKFQLEADAYNILLLLQYLHKYVPIFFMQLGQDHECRHLPKWGDERSKLTLQNLKTID